MSAFHTMGRLMRARSAREGQRADAIRRAEAERRREARDLARANNRLLLVMAGALTVYIVIAIKMAVLALSEPPAANSYQHPTIQNARAPIVDRSGNILATNLRAYSVYAQINDMIDPRAAAEGLAEIFPDLEADRLYRWFTDGRNFVWIKQQISPEQRQAVHDLGEPGLLFGPREVRFYPNGALAAHILGGTQFGDLGVNAAEIKGVAGVEFALNDYLANSENTERPLKLTLDLAVQDALEQRLAGGVRVNNAKGGAAVLMAANTGEIIAMASYPDFDPNHRPAPRADGDADLDPTFNRAALGTYELGSTFKIFNTALAVETGYANLNTSFDATPIRVGGFTIRDYRNYGDVLTLREAMVKSSNTVSARIASAIGTEKQQRLLESLGFMAPTPAELPEAQRAQPTIPKPWRDINTMTISYGHGLAATPLHLAAGYAAMVNGGIMYPPTLIKSDEPRQGTRVIAEHTSRTMRQVLRAIVNEGTASLAKTEGYDIGGKTGTADKTNPLNGAYYKDRNVNTFAAAFPIADPQYVLVVMLDEPSQSGVDGQDLRTAGWTSVPVTTSIVERVAPLLGVRPVYPSDAPIR